MYGEGASVSQALQLFAVEPPSHGQLCAQDCGAQQHPAPAGAAHLSVKRFSRRQLLLTGGIATRVWTASVLLSRWMARHMSSMHILSHLSTAAAASDIDRSVFGSGGGRVLELGCGLGVAGLAAAMCGCKVLLTDVHDVALSACRDAIRTNADRLKSLGSARAFAPGGHMRSIDEFLRASEAGGAGGQAFTMELDWNNLPELAPHQRFSCLIAADVVHEDQHAPLISKVIRVRCYAAVFKLSSHIRFAANARSFWSLPAVQRRRTQPLRHGRVPTSASRGGPAREARRSVAAGTASQWRR